MKNIGLIFIIIFCLIVAGCTNVDSNQILKTNEPTNLKMNEPVNLQNDGNSIHASIDHINIDSSVPPNHIIHVTITVKNTGTKAFAPYWFSKFTDYGGISSGGLGFFEAGGVLLYPDESQTSTEHIIINSDKKYAALKKGATMEVTFIKKDSMTSPVVEIGKASWIVDFNNI
jgi:hypothetical protein